MMSMVHTQGQKDGCFFVHLTADSLHSVAIFEMEMEDQIRKNGRGGHSAALQKREVDGTTFYILREGSTCTLGSMKSLKLATLSFLSILVWRMKAQVLKESERCWWLQAAKFADLKTSWQTQ
jgi:hypothetical protein